MGMLSTFGENTKHLSETLTTVLQNIFEYAIQTMDCFIEYLTYLPITHLLS